VKEDKKDKNSFAFHRIKLLLANGKFAEFPEFRRINMHLFNIKA